MPQRVHTVFTAARHMSPVEGALPCIGVKHGTDHVVPLSVREAQLHGAPDDTAEVTGNRTHLLGAVPLSALFDIRHPRRVRQMFGDVGHILQCREERTERDCTLSPNWTAGVHTPASGSTTHL